MALENMLSDLGFGTKTLAERQHVEYELPAHDPNLYYPHEQTPTTHEHVLSSKHNYNGGHKSNAAMSALTLLAFLFFLNILQQCLKEHMNAMSTPQFMIVTGGKEGDEQISKTAEKIDKHGVKQEENPNKKVYKEKVNIPLKNHAESKNEKVNVGERFIKTEGKITKDIYRREQNSEFVNAMDGSYYNNNNYNGLIKK